MNERVRQQQLPAVFTHILIVLTAQIPRYIRVNTLCWTTELAIKHFKDAGFAYDGDPLLSPCVFF